RELETLPARQSLAAARIDLLSAEIARVDETIVLYRLRLSESALDRAEIAIELARADVARFEAAEPELRQLADGNLGLAMEARAAIVRRAALEQLLLDSEREATALSQSNETVRLVLGAGRLSDETAALLKTVRSSLPDQSEISAALFESERLRGDLQLQLIVWLDDLRASDAPGVGQQADAASAERQRLTGVRRSTLNALIEGARQESELLSEHELVLSELGQQAGELSSLVDRRLVWLRTSERVNWSWLDRVPQGLAWVLSPSSWANAIGALVAGVFGNPGISAVFAFALLALVWLRRRLLDALGHLSDNVGHVGRDTYWTTPLAMGATGLLALPIPLAVSASGWLVAQTGGGTGTFSQSLAQTLILLGPVLFVLCLFLDMCRPNGVFAAHFGWTETARTRLSANLKWFIRVEAGAILLFGLTVFSAPPGITYGVGIAAFVVGSLALAVLTFQFLRPRGGIVSQLRTGPTTSLLLKLLLPIAVVEPLLVGALPFFGFFDTAMELQYKVLQSGALALGGSVLYGLAVRMFMVGNRRFALEKAREKRARLAAERASAAEIEASGETLGTSSDESIADAEVISEQVRSVLRVAAYGSVLVILWMLWSPFIPALGVAGEIPLWTCTVSANGAELREAVTLLDLLTALLFLAAALFAVRNIGGLLEIGVFEPFGLDAASRYAVASITRYIILATAIVLAFSRIGANWSELQWIIAALGVGLGFGLQEIVANFVSGLIILFERPIRVGDVVTIGDLRGTVKSIRIRATTITDFDN
ncbi:MAG: mechanosensitive ion channel domain-containing protein, partial [Pseudomonadota bacterium]